MSAALGKILILKLDRIGAGALEKPHRALDIERIAVAGVGVDDEMRADPIADQRDGLHHFAHADEADIGPPQPRMRDAGAGNIKRFKSRALGDQRGKRIVDTRRDQDRLSMQAR